MYALSISESNFCRGEETSDLGVVGERMAVIMRRKFKEVHWTRCERTKTRGTSITHGPLQSTATYTRPLSRVQTALPSFFIP